ncbi:fibronectin type III domain-containing protein [Aquimarina sp. M1]
MRKLLFVIFVLSVGLAQGIAQQFPITVIPQIAQPSPVNFSNYSDASTLNSPIQLRLLLNDITANNEQIRLKISFEGNGISFESNELVIGAEPLFIDGGTPLELTNTELAPYFEFENIRGINPNTYGAAIPEGSYRFCFEVFDAVTGNRLASKTCATTYIFRNEPPLLNLPLNKINIEPTEVENIVFQWTPRHINVSNVVYELSIVEIWDDTVDPQTAFLSSVPVFETTTRSTTFIYGPSQPLLLTGKRYAWRIQAKALQGAEEIGLFRNEGKSEIYWFSKVNPCEAPFNVYAEAKGTNKINVFWEEDLNKYKEYAIAYREANKPGAEWFTMRTNSGWATIWHLKPGTTYEVKVLGTCKFQDSKFSEIQEVTTATEEDSSSDYNCGIVPDEVAISNQNPHPGLSVGDRITAGDFVITLIEIESQSNGIISGKGFVRVPYLKYARLAVNYEGVLVNTDNQLAQGEIVTVYDENFGDGTEITVDVEIDPIDVITGDEGEITTVTVDYDIDTIEVNDNGGWTITGSDGEEGTLPGGEDYVITDSNNDTYIVSEDGTITQGDMATGGAVTADTTNGADSDGISEIQQVGVTIEFIASGKYSFDKIHSDASTSLASQYPTVTYGDKVYPIAFKAVSKLNGDDTIKAKVTFENDTYTPNDIIFKTKEGISVPATWKDDGSEVTLTLKQTFDYAIEDIVATVVTKEDENKQDIIGTFKLVHLGADVSDIDLIIVPVNNARIENGLERKINEIYNKAGVNFNTRIAETLEVPKSIWDQNENNSLDIGDSSVLSYYTEEENAIVKYFKEQDRYEATKYYMFISDLPVSDSDTNGFMPLKGQFGFVFDTSDQGKIAAHELGHGVFGLEHPFTKYGTPEGTTDFLMDYGGETALSHMDWKKMHAPGLQLYWFQGDEDGASGRKKLSKKEKMLVVLEHLKKSYNDIDEEIPWTVFLRETSGRSTTYSSLTGAYDFPIKDNKNLKFYLKNQPSSSISKIKILKGGEDLNKKDGANITYELQVTIDNSADDFIFEFDHHDELEAFCNEMLIGRDQVYTKSNQSEFSKEIIAYLQDEKFPKNGITGVTDCNNLDVYFAEIPADYLANFDDAQLWLAMGSLLDCIVDDKGTSEEQALLTIIKALGEKNPNFFLNNLITKGDDGKNLFGKLYSKMDNWGGADNFTKLIDEIYSIWKKSEFAVEAVLDVPYESEKALGFYVSDYDLFYDGETSIRLMKEVTYINPRPGTGNNDGIVTQNQLLGTYHIYQPIKLVKYKNITSPGFDVKSGNIPIFVLQAIAQNYTASNTDRGANFAFDAALTVSGIGNIAKLRHLSKLGKLKNLVQGLEGVDALLSTTNLLLKYSGFCEKPTTEGRKGFCEKLGLFGDVMGLASGFGSATVRIAETRKRANDLLEDIEKNPEIITDADDLYLIRKGLIDIIQGGDLTALRKAINRDLILREFTSLENFALTMSSLELLLKYADSCKEDGVCKETLFFLGIIQKGIKVKGLSQKIANQAKGLRTAIEKNPAAYSDDSTKRKSLLEQLETTVFIGALESTPSLKIALADPNNSALKRRFEQASFSKKADLSRAWNALEKFPRIQTYEGGRNLEVLTSVHNRFNYSNKPSYEGLKELFSGNASKQKLIDGLKQANDVFPADLPITFSGIKKGEIIISNDRNGKGDEVARFVDGVLEKRKVIPDDEVSQYQFVKKYDEQFDIHKKGDQVGFRQKIDTYKNVSYDEFIRSVRDFSGGKNTELSKKAYQLWGQENWKDLETLFVSNKLNGEWPPYNGFKSITKIEKGTSLAGRLYDRFQESPELGGSFASPVLSVSEGINNYVFTHDSRALKGVPKRGTYHIVFRIKESVPANLEFSQGEAIPWFGYEGKAEQIKSSKKFDEIKEHVEIVEMQLYNGSEWKEMKFNGNEWVEN